MSETQHIGRKIRDRREHLGWSLEYTAEKSNLCSRALEDIELGKTDPHLSTVMKIAYALSMDLGELNSCYAISI
ncbi:MAG: helix-turn-helix transcriptional regulator [Clostridia bacterium]|nr:helix-turn-helix transcriptional regulator [Clostridia bacterium]